MVAGSGKATLLIKINKQGYMEVIRELECDPVSKYEIAAILVKEDN